MDDSDLDRNYVQTYEVIDCKKEVFSACHLCQSLSCCNHSINIGPCSSYHKVKVIATPKKEEKGDSHTCTRKNIHTSYFSAGRCSCGRKKEMKTENKKKEAHNNRVAGRVCESP